MSVIMNLMENDMCKWQIGQTIEIWKDIWWKWCDRVAVKIYNNDVNKNHNISR